jgi:hypothetical protein
MSRIDAALRRARQAAGGTADWQNPAPAIQPSSRELESLRSEVNGTYVAPQTPRLRMFPEPSTESPLPPIHLPRGFGSPSIAPRPAAVAVEALASVDDVEEQVDDVGRKNGRAVSDDLAAAIDLAANIDAGLDLELNPPAVTAATVHADPQKPEGGVDPMFEALDRVLTQTPLTASRRARRVRAAIGERGPADV